MVSSTLVAQRSMEGTEGTGEAGAPWPRAVIGALLLVLVTVSVSSAVAVSFTDIGAFLASNHATPSERNLVLRVLFIASAVSSVGFGLCAWLGGPHLKQRIATRGLRLPPVSLAQGR